MENRASSAAQPGDPRSAYSRESALHLDESDAPAASSDVGAAMENPTVEVKRLEALRIPVGCNLADVERWMIFATLQKCGGNKTRAAALLGVSLKTLYNRLNAYRAQGLTMDYDLPASEPGDDGRASEREGKHEELGGVEARGLAHESGRLVDNLRETQ